MAWLLSSSLSLQSWKLLTCFMFLFEQIWTKNPPHPDIKSIRLLWQLDQNDLVHIKKNQKQKKLKGKVLVKCFKAKWIHPIWSHSLVLERQKMMNKHWLKINAHTSFSMKLCLFQYNIMWETYPAVWTLFWFLIFFQWLFSLYDIVEITWKSLNLSWNFTEFKLKRGRRTLLLPVLLHKKKLLKRYS